MILKAVTISLGLFFIVGCSTGLPSSESIIDSPHKTKATALLERNPENDARAFFGVGGIGYIMAYGGLRMPIGTHVKARSDSRDFESLEPFAPILYASIFPLLQDVDGPPTMENFVGGVELVRERQYYQDVRGAYATRFNERMASLEQ